MSDRSKIAKNNVKNNSHEIYAFYNDDMNAEMLREKQLENDMETALQNNEFVVYYQPKFELHTERVIAAEALVRWLSPKSGFMNPGVFIPVFEKNGFIVRLDMYVFEHVCASLRRWIDEGQTVIPISVNFSRLNMYRNDFVEQLLSIIHKYDISTDLLEIELTESALVYNDELIVSRMHELKEAGFRLT
ncbi:EAL domain-containing protein, partial [Christensenella sp.]|uniref:EAL domain-containing protein n=1 Tax=Christensenella sp. TaxID=1935934 RepID=UPI002B1F0E3D